MTLAEARTLYEELSSRVMRSARTPWGTSRPSEEYSSIGTSLGYNGRDGCVELVRDHVYWHPEYGVEAGLHIDLPNDVESAWKIIEAGYPERLRMHRS